MTSLDYRDFWSVAIEEVPAKTGAEGVMDCADIRDVLANLDFDLAGKSVLDVGCGTGRVAQLCGSWAGVDISPAMVAYCINHGLNASVIAAPIELTGRFEAVWGDRPFDVVVCLSVFTHISHDDQRAYLQQFRGLAPELLVDVLPGEPGGGIAAWYTDPADFEVDLHAAGFEVVVDSYERRSADGHVHLYYRCW